MNKNHKRDDKSLAAGKPSDRKLDAKRGPVADAPPQVRPGKSQKTKSAPILIAADKVEESSIESFPASDPPGYGSGHA